MHKLVDTSFLIGLLHKTHTYSCMWKYHTFNPTLWWWCEFWVCLSDLGWICATGADVFAYLDVKQFPVSFSCRMSVSNCCGSGSHAQLFGMCKWGVKSLQARRACYFVVMSLLVFACFRYPLVQYWHEHLCMLLKSFWRAFTTLVQNRWSMKYRYTVSFIGILAASPEECSRKWF